MRLKVVSLFPVIFMASLSCADAAEAWIANRTIQPGEMVQPTDIDQGNVDNPSPDLFSTSRSPAGMDARRRILSGHAITERDMQKHMLVKANAPVRVVWHAGGISMELEARALQQGAEGDAVRVLNPTSSRTLEGVVQMDGSVKVGF